MIAHDGRTGTWRQTETNRGRSTYMSVPDLLRPPWRTAMRSTFYRPRIRSLAALVAIAIVLAACTAPAGGTTAPVNGASPAPAAPTSGGYSY
jgi:hypothetical protein